MSDYASSEPVQNAEHQHTFHSKAEQPGSPLSPEAALQRLPAELSALPRRLGAGGRAGTPGEGTPLQRQHARMLSDPKLQEPMYTQRKAELFLQLQRAYGNTYARGVVHLLREQGLFRQSKEAPPVQPAAGPQEEEQPLQRGASAEAGTAPNVAGEIQSSRGSGQKLDEAARAKLEPVMGVDLGSVTIHADSQADRLSRSVQAEAFTTGSDIYFRSGRYDPHAESGLHLIAHEATHTIQQSKGTVSGTQHSAGVKVSEPDDHFEREAEQNAVRTISHIQRQASTEIVQRQSEKKEQRPTTTPGTPLLQRHPNSAYNEKDEEQLLLQTRRDPAYAHLDASALTEQPAKGSAMPPGVIQRTMWSFDGEKWENERRETGLAAEHLAKIKNPLKGDKFDDASGHHFSSKNVAVKGEEHSGGLFSKTTYGDVPAKTEEFLRKAVVLAKVSLRTAIQKIADAVFKLRQTPEIDPGAAFLKAFSLAFNVPEDASTSTKVKHLYLILEGVKGIAKGMDEADLPLMKAADKVKRFGKEIDLSDAEGYVERGVMETLGSKPKIEREGQFTRRSADIHINWKMLSDEAVTAKTLIHEASHKFIGTWDFSYGVSNKEGTAKWLGDQATAKGTDEKGARSAMKWDAFADVIRLKVQEGLKGVAPVGPGLPPPPKEVSEARKMAYDLKAALSALPGEEERAATFSETLDVLMSNVIIPQGTRTELGKFKDTEILVEYIAQNGNELGLKGPAPLLILPPSYLLNNADSYMDFVTKLGGS